MAAPLGNLNAAKGKIWNDALRKAIVQDDGKRLHAAAEMLLNKAAEGEAWAVREIADRLDGRPAQAVDLGSDPDRPMIQKLIREIVKPNDQDG
jgi:hypothetical protein